MKADKEAIPARSARKPTTEIEDTVLGPWVYCRQHLKPHTTGWCTVDLSEKVGLGPMKGSADEQYREALSKCRRMGLEIWKAGE